jgi:hypothetical protein
MNSLLIGIIIGISSLEIQPNPGFLSLYFCSRYEWPHPFLMSLAFTETALNVAYAAHAALPAAPWYTH